MTALAVILVWAGYSSVLYGYCLFRGYQVTPKQLLSTTWPPNSVSNVEGDTSQGTAPPPDNSGRVSQPQQTKPR